MRIEVAEFGPAPLDDWSCYPGRRTEFSYLFCGDYLLGLDRIDFDAELGALDAASMHDRHPVLAYGSNACPAQLERKYRAMTCSSIIPMTRAWVRDLAIGFSDHQSSYGAVPANVFVAADAQTEVFVAWLDDEQLVDLDRTEARNYERRSLDLGRHGLYVADGSLPRTVDMYTSRRGLLTVDGITPAVAGIDTTYRAGPLLTQLEVQELRRTRGLNP